MKIGVFDSGVGGLTVLRKLIEKYPNNEYIYFGDTKNMPYGDKTIEELQILSSNIMEFLIKQNVELIIIACGTVSSNLSDYLKIKYNIPIIDIISPVVNYLNNSDYEKIGVLATNATINSKIFSKNIKKDIIEVACPDLVPIIESNNFNLLDEALNKYLHKVKECELIILGCTHYPIIKNQIFEKLNSNVRILDMSECITFNEKNSVKKIKLYFSKLDDSTIENIKSILKDEIYSISVIN